MWKLKKYVPKEPIERCQIECKFYFADLRRRDMSNVFESIADILVDSKIIKDDCWKVIYDYQCIAMKLDKDNPRVIVELKY
jgi:Holliday junction resolvase RusA-like endonuclease